MALENSVKFYSGSLESEELAACVYDRFVIQRSGLQAKTNFSYRRIDLINILQDIEDDALFNRQHGEPSRKRISFNHFDVEQLIGPVAPARPSH